MKKLLFFRTTVFACACFCVITASAQHLFGYFNYNEIVKQLADYTTVVSQLDELKHKFNEETKRVEKDFNEKYEEFLEGQKEFPPIILQKRQVELQEMMEKNVAFKQEARRLYAKAEKEAMDTIRHKINAVVAAIGKERKYAFIINADETTCPWINPEQGICLDDEILQRLK